VSNGDGLSDGITSAEGRLLAVQMGAMRDDVREVKDTMRDMARSLEQLVRIEEQQKDMRAAMVRAFDEIRTERERREPIESRIGSIERDLPGLRELRRWVIAGVLSGLAMLASSLMLYFFQNHVR